MYKLDELTELERDAAWADAVETANQSPDVPVHFADGVMYGADVRWEIALCLSQRELQRP